MRKRRTLLFLTLAMALVVVSGARASVLGDPFVVSALALGPADDPAWDPTPPDRDTDAVYDGIHLFLTNVTVQGDVTGLPLVFEGCDPSLPDTGAEGFVLVSGAPIWVENADWALSLYLERGPACTGYDTALDARGNAPSMPALARAWGSLVNLAANGDVVEADLLFGASMTVAYASDPDLGTIPAGVIGYHLAFDVSSLTGSLVALSGQCGNDAQCDDGLLCNGSETCNLALETCQAAAALDCSGLTSQCGLGLCTEGIGCTVDSLPDGTPCSDGNFCTDGDACVGGVCAGTNGGADSDGDGFCDEHELLMGCNPFDGAIIPPQPAAYSGGRIASKGEVLLTFAVPDNRDVVVPAHPSCAESGTCGPSRVCTAGKIGDPCAQDADCNQPPFTCRVILNHSASPNMALFFAKLRRRPVTDVSARILPMAPGCSRKVDFTIPHLPEKRRAALVIKVTGTVDGKLRRDRDRIRFLRE